MLILVQRNPSWQRSLAQLSPSLFLVIYCFLKDLEIIPTKLVLLILALCGMRMLKMFSCVNAGKRPDTDRRKDPCSDPEFELHT